MKIIGILTALVLSIFSVNATTTYTSDSVYNVSTNGGPVIANVDVNFSGASADSIEKFYVNFGLKGVNFLYSSNEQAYVDSGSGTVTLTLPSISGSSYAEEYQYQVMSKKTGFAPVSVSAIKYFTTLGSPKITQNPSNKSVCLGSPILLIAASQGATSVNWQKSTNGGVTWNNVSGQGDDSLYIASSVSTDAAMFRLMASNNYGSVSSLSATVTINNPVQITSQPAPSISANPGDDVTAVVQTNITASHLWKKVGSAGNYGGSATLQLNDVAVGYDDGDYFDIVWATNACGTTYDSSTIVTVTVSQFTPDLQVLSVTENTNGSGFEFSLTVNGFSMTTALTALYGIGSITDSVLVTTIGGGGQITLPVSIAGFQPCNTVMVQFKAESGAGITTTVPQSYNTAVVQPDIVNQSLLSANQFSNKLVLNGFGDTKGSCADGICKAVLRWGYTSTSIATIASGGWKNGLSGEVQLSDSILGLAAGTTVWYQWEIVNVANPSLNKKSAALQGQTSTVPTVYSASMSFPQYAVTNFVAGGSGKLTFNASTTDPNGATVYAVHSTDPTIGLQAIPEGPVNVYGASLTTYTLNLTGLTMDDTNYVQLSYTLNTDGSQGTSVIKMFWTPLILGVEEASAEEMVKVFPNPTSDFIMIETQNKGELALSDMLGKIVMKEELVKGVNKFEVSNLPSGLYFYQVGDNSGKIVVR